MTAIFHFVFTLFSLMQSAFETLIDFLTSPFSNIIEDLPAFIQWIIPEWLGDFTILELSFGAGLVIFLIKVIVNFITD